MACKALQFALVDLLAAATLVCSTMIIAVFDPAHPGQINILFQLHYLAHEKFFKDPEENVFETPWYLESVIDPSPVVFCFAILLYAFASLAFYRSHIQDRYQGHVLAVFAISGVLIPIACGVAGTRLFHAFQASMPSAIATGLVLSAVGHCLWRFKPRDRPVTEVDDYDFDWDMKIRGGQKLW